MKLPDAASVRRFAVDLTALTLLLTGGLCLAAAVPAAEAVADDAQTAPLKYATFEWRCAGCANGCVDYSAGRCDGKPLGPLRPSPIWCASCTCVGDGLGFHNCQLVPMVVPSFP